MFSLTENSSSTSQLITETLVVKANMKLLQTIFLKYNMGTFSTVLRLHKFEK